MGQCVLKRFNPTKMYQPYYNIIAAEDYLIGSSINGSYAKIFNLTSFAHIGIVNKAAYFSSAVYVRSKSIFVFGSDRKGLAYLDLSTFLDTRLNWIYNESPTIGAVTVEKSSD